MDKAYGIICGHCQKFNTPKEIIESLQRFKNDAIHIRGDCKYCMGFLKYVSYAESYTVRNILHKVYRRESMESILNGVIIYDDKMEEIY